MRAQFKSLQPTRGETLPQREGSIGVCPVRLQGSSIGRTWCSIVPSCTLVTTLHLLELLLLLSPVKEGVVTTCRTLSWWWRG